MVAPITIIGVPGYFVLACLRAIALAQVHQDRPHLRPALIRRYTPPPEARSHQLL
jgi:hypothetical protein